MINIRFEHKRVYGHGIAANIKKLEAEGWEMCGVENNPNDLHSWFCFKRRVDVDTPYRSAPSQ